MEFYGTVKDGKVALYDEVAYNKHVGKYEDMEVMLELKKKKKHRSLNQNAYYHGVVVPAIAGRLEYTTQQAKDAIKWKFLMIHGEIPTVRSTSDLSTIEFEDLMATIRSWASLHMNLYIEQPHESKFDYTLPEQ